MKRFSLFLLLIMSVAFIGNAKAVVTGGQFFQSYTCSGSTSAFPFNFAIYAPYDLSVQVLTGGVSTTLTPITAYTVALPIYQPGGTVTLTSSGLCPTGSTLTITRNTPQTQTTSYKNNQYLNQTILMSDLDKVWMAMQEQNFNYCTASCGPACQAAIQASIIMLNPGATAPTVTYAYMEWVDTSTTPPTLRIRNSLNTGWVAIGTINDSGTFIATNAASAANSALLGGFAASQTPGANQISVNDANGFSPFVNWSGNRIKVPTRVSGDNGRDAANTAFVHTAVTPVYTRWTPTLIPGSSGTITLSSSSVGWYTKIDKLVFVFISLEVSSVSSPVGALYVTGIPVPDTLRAATMPLSINCIGLTSAATTAIQASVIIYPTPYNGEVLITKFAAGAAGDAAALIQANSIITISGVYLGT